MKILITGGSGFIGKNLQEQLHDRYSISAPAHEELDLLDSRQVDDYLKRNCFDAVIHCAWLAARHADRAAGDVVDYNLRMFFNLARCSRKYNKLLYYGSASEYGRPHWIAKMREEYFDSYVPKERDVFSKYVICKYAERSSNIYNLRTFGVYGRYEDWRIRFISNACCRAMWGLPVTIKQNRAIDYIHVNDLVKITEWFLNNRPKEYCYNVCSGKVYDLLTLAKKVIKISGKQLDIKIASDGLGLEYSGDNSKLLGEIGDYSFRDIDVCIAELYRWYKDRKNDIDKRLLFE